MAGVPEMRGREEESEVRPARRGGMGNRNVAADTRECTQIEDSPWRMDADGKGRDVYVRASVFSTGAFEVQGEELLEDRVVAQGRVPCVRVEDGLVELLVGEV